jgi:hypothetical protein
MARPPAFGDRGAHSKVRSGKRQRLRAGFRTLGPVDRRFGWVSFDLAEIYAN